MSTLREYAYDLYELMRANLTDNEVEDIRQIEFWIKNQREFWITNDLEKSMLNLNQGNSFVQTLDNISVSNVDKGMLSGNVGVYVKRTELIPSILPTKTSRAIEGIYSQCLIGEKVELVPWDHFVVAGNKRFNNKTIYASYFNGYIYFSQKANLDNYKLLNKVKISAIFRDPEDLADYTNADGNPAYSENMEFPMSGKFWENIKRGIINNNFKLVMNGEDSQTDSASI